VDPAEVGVGTRASRRANHRSSDRLVRNLIAHVAALRVAADGVEAVAISSAILALFESHLSKENDLLIPVLVADPNVAPGALLGGMHELLG
jgi:hypothetical protein